MHPIVDLAGEWSCEIPGQKALIHLPGTLDESSIGWPDDPAQQWKVDDVRRIGFYHDGDPIVTRLTRKYTYTGEARIEKCIDWQVPTGKRIFVTCDRARQLRLFVNGTETRSIHPACLNTPYRFEVTDLVTGHDTFLFLSDNSYRGWPAGAIVYSSAASDETQTNWNGLLGSIRIEDECPVFIEQVSVYPEENSLSIRIDWNSTCLWEGSVRISSSALLKDQTITVSVTPGASCTQLHLPIRPDAARWDIDDGKLHDLTIAPDGYDPVTVRFGIRSFQARDGYLLLNGRRVFLRSEANCAVFPETGYCPMDVASWHSILLKYKAYGVNAMRFHSHCPPDAAFTAADELGILMQPELSHWDPIHAFTSPESQAYYLTELIETLRMLANHPSFVMLTFGNELACEETGLQFMHDLLQAAKNADPTRLYANGSNCFYGAHGPDPDSDFYTSMNCQGLDMRATCDGPTGWLNHDSPDTAHQYSRTAALVREQFDQPVFSFEVGQYEILPDFDQIKDFRGITLPAQLQHIQNLVQKKGYDCKWKQWVEATGELSLICYQAEIEAALRTKDYSGISLLGIQDFPGQGTALVGMMDAHLHAKPYPFADPVRFRTFFADHVLLAVMPSFTYTAGEVFQAEIQFANYGKESIVSDLSWKLGEQEGSFPACSVPSGSVSTLGVIRIKLPSVTASIRFDLQLMDGGLAKSYPVWIYPETTPVCPESIHECRSLDETALRILRSGGSVYLSPDSSSESIPNSIQSQFSTDFWSVCTFPQQSGAMGLYINTEHPVFEHFPTEFHTNWQWWPMAVQRAMILPEPSDTIVTQLDSFGLLRPMSMLFECRCEGGKLMVSSMGLHQLRQFPSARALQHAIYSYMASDSFQPEEHRSIEWINRIFMP